MAHGFELVDANDRDDRCASPSNAGTHLVEQRGKIGNLGFTGGIVDRRGSKGEHRSHHDVLGCPDARKPKLHFPAGEAVGLANYAVG